MITYLEELWPLIAVGVVVLIFVYLLVRTNHYKDENNSLGTTLSETEKELNKLKTRISEKEKKLEEYTSVFEDLSLKKKKSEDERDELLDREGALKGQLEEAQNEISYLHDFAQRFRHDCGARFKIIKDALDKAESSSRLRALRQVQFMQEAVNVQLAPSICEYVRHHVDAGKERFRLDRRINELIDTFQERNPDNRIELETQDEIDVWGKWPHLEILMDNLLSNALIHGFDQGPIQISVKKDDEVATIEVYNDGEHIPEDAHSSVFELGNSSKEEDLVGQNNGYGLYFVNEVVKGYGGRVGIKNTSRTKGLIGKKIPGVRFIVELPMIEMIMDDA